MADIRDERIVLAVTILIIAVLSFWLLPVELLPTLSEISGSEISPIFSYVAGVLLIDSSNFILLQKMSASRLEMSAQKQKKRP